METALQSQKKLGFYQAFKNVYFEKLFTYSGRSTRAEFLKSWAFSILVLLFVSIASTIAFAVLGGYGNFDTAAVAIGVAVGLFYVWMILANISLTCRRWHDVGISFKWYIPLIAISFISNGYALTLGETPGWLYLVMALTAVFGFIINFFPSQTFDNRFGPYPYKEIVDEQESNSGL